MKNGNITYQKSISEAVGQVHSKKNSLECAQHKHSYEWKEIDVDT